MQELCMVTATLQQDSYLAKYIQVNKMRKINLFDLICIGGGNWKPTQNSRQWI